MGYNLTSALFSCNLHGFRHTQFWGVSYRQLVVSVYSPKYSALFSCKLHENKALEKISPPDIFFLVKNSQTF